MHDFHLKRAFLGACLGSVAVLATTIPGAAADIAIVLALPAEPTSLDVCDDSSNVNARVLKGNVVEALTRLDPAAGEVLPLLATTWTRADTNNWLFTVRPGVKFHDGAPLDAKAVAASINRTLNPDLACQNIGLFSNKTTAAAESDMVVRLTTENPDPILPARIAYSDLLVAQHAGEDEERQGNRDRAVQDRLPHLRPVHRAQRQ